MTDEPANVADLARPFTLWSVDELMVLKAEYEARGIRIVNSVPWEALAPLLAGAAIYFKTFLETLAKHNAEALIDAVHTRVRKNGKTIAFLVGADGDAIAKFAVIGDLPDAARLALLDPDVIAEALRGKILRWMTMPWPGVRTATRTSPRNSLTESSDTAWRPALKDPIVRPGHRGRAPTSLPGKRSARIVGGEVSGQDSASSPAS